MKTLTILRHGKSSWEQTYIDDINRPLLEKGRVRTQKVCNCLKDLDLLPDGILSSPALRAVETAHIVIEELKLSLVPQISKKLYPGRVQDIVQIISELKNGVEHVMIVGHNPVFTDLAMHLSKGLNIEWLPTSGLVVLEFEIGDWKTILSAKGKCIHYIKPNKANEM